MDTQMLYGQFLRQQETETKFKMEGIKSQKWMHSTTKKIQLALTDLEKVTRVSTRENKLSEENRL